MKTKHWILIFAAVALLCAVAIVLFPLPQQVASAADIYQNGILIRTVPLGQDARFTITAPNGGTNTVAVSGGRIRVEQATCPDGLCVNQGWSRTEGYPIVCLPHGLVIQPKGGDTPFDAVTN
ncbi:MAG: NusG domain II-containing protein [Oscillospiraceae bacterium]|nr:NusG domain II-containing protein [Oscillospiraceae bacterium]